LSDSRRVRVPEELLGPDPFLVQDGDLDAEEVELEVLGREPAGLVEDLETAVAALVEDLVEGRLGQLDLDGIELPEGGGDLNDGIAPEVGEKAVGGVETPDSIIGARRGLDEGISAAAARTSGSRRRPRRPGPAGPTTRPSRLCGRRPRRV
jgi:hypothetical protein